MNILLQFSKLTSNVCQPARLKIKPANKSSDKHKTMIRLNELDVIKSERQIQALQHLSRDATFGGPKKLIELIKLGEVLSGPFAALISIMTRVYSSRKSLPSLLPSGGGEHLTAILQSMEIAQLKGSPRSSEWPHVGSRSVLIPTMPGRNVNADLMLPAHISRATSFKLFFIVMANNGETLPPQLSWICLVLPFDVSSLF